MVCNYATVCSTNAKAKSGAKAEESKKELQSEFEQKLMDKFEIGVKEARKLIRKTMTAYPNETDLLKLMEYAEKLLK